MRFRLESRELKNACSKTFRILFRNLCVFIPFHRIKTCSTLDHFIGSSLIIPSNNFKEPENIRRFRILNFWGSFEIIGRRLPENSNSTSFLKFTRFYWLEICKLVDNCSTFNTQAPTPSKGTMVVRHFCRHYVYRQKMCTHYQTVSHQARVLRVVGRLS